MKHMSSVILAISSFCLGFCLTSLVIAGCSESPPKKASIMAPDDCRELVLADSDQSQWNDAITLKLVCIDSDGFPSIFWQRKGAFRDFTNTGWFRVRVVFPSSQPITPDK